MLQPTNPIHTNISRLLFLSVSALFLEFSPANPSAVLAADLAAVESGRSPALSVPEVNPSLSLLAQGQQVYLAGQIQQSIDLWETALDTSQVQGNTIAKIQTLNFLTAAYVEAGNLQAAQTSSTESLSLITTLQSQTSQSQSLYAQALNNQGMVELNLGQPETALETWEKAGELYLANDDLSGVTTTRVNQAQAFQTLGQYRKSRDVILAASTDVLAGEDTLLKVQALESLGIVLQNLGELFDSKAVLEESWRLSREIGADAETATVLFNLGNVARDLESYEAAQQYYETSYALAANPVDSLNTRLNQLRLAVELKQFEAAGQYIGDITQTLDTLPASRPKNYAVLNFAESLLRLAQIEDNGDYNFAPVAAYRQPQPMVAWLQKVLAEAIAIEDLQAQAYTLNQLGKVYQAFGQFSEARTLSAQSLDLSQRLNADDLVARSASQLAAVQKSLGDTERAIATYEIAFQKLQSLRRDLVAVGPDVQFEFRANIEPIYRSYVDLLLQDDPSQADLQQARTVMEALQLAELDNYFQDACLDLYPVSLEEFDNEAAIVYPILLEDRLEIIVSLPDKTLRNYRSEIPRDELSFALDQFHSSFSPGYPRDRHWRYSKKFHNWLVKPFEADLLAQGAQTLVFIPDSFLKNVPMSALYDGEQYLIEKFSIAISPSLQLFPQGESAQTLDLFIGGLSEARQGFDSLPGVTKEIASIAQKSNSRVLLNQTFTYDKLVEQINNDSFPVVHLATHGQFSSDPDETFLLTWDERISMENFDRLFEKRRLGILDPIELLVMSACQTARGDDRAVLGLSGFALRSGAKSTLGSLWPVSDESTTELMISFYQELVQEGNSKAEALRQAQLKLLRESKFSHPYFWSAFILVGNWS